MTPERELLARAAPFLIILHRRAEYALCRAEDSLVKDLAGQATDDLARLIDDIGEYLKLAEKS